jgi:hypothetical protein
MCCTVTYIPRQNVAKMNTYNVKISSHPALQMAMQPSDTQLLYYYSTKLQISYIQFIIIIIILILDNAVFVGFGTV